jgi:hypothetical protein
MRLNPPSLPIFFGIASLVLGMWMAPSAAPEKPATAAKTAPNAQPKKAAAKPVAVDKQSVQELYQSGEFDQLIALLENMRRERSLRDRDDSVFIYKYLGVVYGADMNTRRKAESFLYQMLKLDPRQDLEDLEVGDAILSMFREVRKRYDRTANDSLTVSEREHVKKSLKTFGYPIDSTGKNLVNVNLDSNAAEPGASVGQTGADNSTGTPASGATAEQDASDRRWLWVAGGAAAVTLVGIGTIFLMSEPETKTTTLVTEVK